MKKLMSLMMAALTICAAAVVCAPQPVFAEPGVIEEAFVESDGTALEARFDISNTAPAELRWLNLWACYPTNGTVQVKYIETDASDVVRTNAWTPAIPLLNTAAGGSGYLTNNLAQYAMPCVYRKREILLSFSTATQATVQVWAELMRAPIPR